jgi:hypothetical protein
VDLLSFLANIASIVGLGLTVAVFLKVKVLATRYAFQGRSPAIKRKLVSGRKLLNTSLNNSLQDSVSEALAIVKPALDSLVSLAGGALQADAVELRDRVAVLLEAAALERSMSECRAVEMRLTVVIEGLEHANMDLVWRERDAS